jgi:uncharacterized membrane protein YfcA
LDDLSLTSWLVFALILAFAGLVHGTLGLGFPVLATPLLALMVDVRLAILITLLPTATVNLGSIIQGGNWSESIGRFWPLALYSVIGGVVGTRALVLLDPTPFKLLLAALVLLYLGVSQSSGFGMTWVKRHLRWSMLGFGVLAGFAGGTTNVMLPVMAIFALELGLARTAMIQTFNMCFLLGKMTQIAVLTHAGLFTLSVAATTAPLALVSGVALVLGMRMREHIEAQIYQRIVRILLGLTAALLIGQYLLSQLPVMLAQST